MKKKFLAVVITAAMVAAAMPGTVFAEAAAEDAAQMQETAATQMEEEQETGYAETAPAEQETEYAETEPAESEENEKTEITGMPEIQEIPEIEEKTETEGEASRADVVDTQDKLEAALARGGEIDLTGQRIELTRPLTVNSDVVIRGGTLAGTDSVSGNLVTLMENSVTLDNVTIETSSANKSALHVYGTKLAVKDLTIDHRNAAGGAPVIINNKAKAVFTGNISLTLGTGSWYGINVDSAEADFSGAVLNVTPVTDTQSVICREGDGASVSGAVFTVVVTEKDGGGSGRQTAYVADSNLAQFVAAKTAAGADVSRIELHKNVTLTAPLVLSEALTVTGVSENFAIIGSEAVGKDNVVTVTAEGVELSGVSIRTTAFNKSALHIYKAETILKDITLDNTETAGGAAMLVNGGNAKIYGTLRMLLGENSWGGINVDTTNGNAGVVFADGSVAEVTGGGKDAIYVDEEDKNNGNTVTITGAEDAGLVQDADGNYIPADTAEDPDNGEETPNPGDAGDAGEDENTGGGTPAGESKPADSGKEPTDGEDYGERKETENDGRTAPRTGDTGAFSAALTALFGSGTAAGMLIRRRKK